eukprot:COSAG06_NODE_22090_length_734_cov_1.321260_2_plen_62_part_01
MKHGTVVMGETLECKKIDLPCSQEQLLEDINATSQTTELCGPDGFHRVSSCMAEVQQSLIVY